MMTRSPSPFSAVSPTVRQTRATLEREFSEITRLEPRLSRLALNEAEALAWQSGFPLLVFPALAEEKIHALMAWRDYQASIRRVNPAPGSGARWEPEVARFHRNRRRGRMLTPTRSGRLASLSALMMTLLVLATTAISTGEAEARAAQFHEAKAVEFPAQGALPARFPSDLKVEQFDPGEPDYYLFGSPERSLAQVNQIQAAMPPGRFTPPPNDWRYLANTRRILTQGGELRIMAIGDSIVNDTMRSGWLSALRAAYPMAEISGTVYVRGGGGAQHFRENDRLDRQVFPRRPDLVFLGGISQRSIADLAALIAQLRAGLPQVEIVLGTGAFGTADPRDASALSDAPHSGTGDYGRRLRQLAEEQRCAFLDFTSPWAEYLNSSGLHPHRFYRDVVHANEFGEQVLAKIFLGFWQPELQPAIAPVQSLEWFAESRTDPRPLEIRGLRLDLRDARHTLEVLLARDPDDAGPAEAELTSPARLLTEPEIVAAINANAFAHTSPPPDNRLGTWRAGDPVNISGWAMHPARQASQPTPNENSWSFWVTVDGRARVSPLEPQGAARLAVAGFAPLMVDGQITAEPGGPLHPRTAIGVDLHGHRVVMVVVDGRQPGYSEGMSLAELAELMRSLGCHDALNLDGGGSSILFRRREDGSLAIMNRPASIPARPIPVMLVVRSVTPEPPARD